MMSCVRRLVAATSFAALVLASPAARADPVDVCVDHAEKAQVLRDEGKFRRARQELLACTESSCPAAVRTDCGRWLSEVEAATPTVVVRAHDAAARDVGILRVRVNGESRPDYLDGRAFALDPGPQRLALDHAAGVVEVEIVVREGERARVLDVLVPARPVATERSAPRKERPAPTTTWLLGAASLVATGAGVGLWAVGRGEWGDLRAGCGATSSCASSDVDSSRAKLVVGDVLVAVGVVAAGAAIWTYLVRPEEPRAAARAGLR